VRLGSRPTNQGSIERAGTLRSVEKILIGLPLPSAPRALDSRLKRSEALFSAEPGVSVAIAMQRP
jgi:hypothetical protein